MKRNVFGDPSPIGASEIFEALEELEFSEDLYAIIDFNDEDESDFKGFTAQVIDNDDPDHSFMTLGYESREALVADLRAAGITDVQSY